MFPDKDRFTPQSRKHCARAMTMHPVCTCKQKLKTFRRPSEDILCFDARKASSGHLFSFVITNPKILTYHYYRSRCYCRDTLTPPPSIEFCLAKFVDEDDEFYRQVLNFKGTIHVSSVLICCEFCNARPPYNIAMDLEANFTDAPCEGENCKNPFECKQTGEMMHNVLMVEIPYDNSIVSFGGDEDVVLSDISVSDISLGEVDTSEDEAGDSDISLVSSTDSLHYGRLAREE